MAMLFSNIILILLALAILQTIATASDADAAKTTLPRSLQQNGISLAGILDTSNYEWAEVVLAVTVELLNARNNGFFDSELSDAPQIRLVDVLDTGCDGFQALSAYYKVKDQIDGVIGARCSGASIPLAWIGALDNVPQVSMASTSSKLSDKKQFPNFSRVISPDDERGQVGALVATMKLFGWDRVTVLTTDTPYAKDLATSFQGLFEGEIAYQGTIELKDGNIVDASMDQVLEGVPFDDPRQHSKVVVMVAHSQHVFRILQRAGTILPEETFYVGSDGWAGRSPDSTDWLPYYPGYLAVVPYVDESPDSVYRKFLELGLALGRENANAPQLKSVLDSNGHLPGHSADYTVDAVIAMVLALARVPADRRHDGNLVANILRKIDFQGLTGRVRFTQDGDRKDPKFSIINYQRLEKPERKTYRWVGVGVTGIESDSAYFGRDGIEGVCFGGLGCGFSTSPSASFPVPPVALWVPLVLVLLCTTFVVSFGLYRHRKIQASRKTRAILASKESELQGYRNSMVDMCAAEDQYVPASVAAGAATTNSSSKRASNAKATAKGVSGRWCWKETPVMMSKWVGSAIEGDPSDCWIRYDTYSNSVLELAWQEQGQSGVCEPMSGYTVNFRTMIQTKDLTKFRREVKRVEVRVEEVIKGRPPSASPAYDMSSIFEGGVAAAAIECPREIRNEPQMVLVPGDIVQISKKRDDGWAYGSKLHLADEPLGRRLVQLALSNQDTALFPSSADGFRTNDETNQYEDCDDELHDTNNNDDGPMIITDKNGWFPMSVTRVPNTDDLGTLRTTLGGTDDLAPPKHWDPIADASIVQKSKYLDPQSHEYQKVADAFWSTLSQSMLKIVSIQRIQNMAMWQSYVVKRKTVLDREKQTGSYRSSQSSLPNQTRSRFERSWLWHGTNEDSIEKIIQQGFNRSFCGKNATMYGKGVYFARDASYSSSNAYSPPNWSGHKYMLACSVVVGEFCRGKQDARTPDLRDATKNMLYDSTVDSISNPSLFVTYHDAQAYPEYLVVFKKK